MRKCAAPRPGYGAAAMAFAGAPPHMMGYFAQPPMMTYAPMKGKGNGKAYASPAPLFASVGKGSGGKYPEWQCDACFNNNFGDRAFCNMRKCGKARVLTEWICTQCGNTNFADRAVCNMRKCGAARPDVDPAVYQELSSKGLA